MQIYMSVGMSNKLARYLNGKYWAKTEELARQGMAYSQRQMAKDIGLKEGALRRMMDETKPVKGITFAYLEKLAQYYGLEFLVEFNLWKTEKEKRVNGEG